MDTQQALEAWRAQLSEKQKQLHDLAAVMLKKNLKADMEKDNGSYYPEKCHDFKKWLATLKK
jgi:hypothetical protein